jgi:hypothetical protein
MKEEFDLLGVPFENGARQYASHEPHVTCGRRSFDNLVCADQQGGRHREAERFGCL